MIVLLAYESPILLSNNFLLNESFLLKSSRFESVRLYFYEKSFKVIDYNVYEILSWDSSEDDEEYSESTFKNEIFKNSYL